MTAAQCADRNSSVCFFVRPKWRITARSGFLYARGCAGGLRGLFGWGRWHLSLHHLSLLKARAHLKYFERDARRGGGLAPSVGVCRRSW